MTFATDILDRLASHNPAQPRLTWYGADDERVELSGRVLANWVTKATNLLVDEADVEPGSKVLLDLPVHWRSLVWGLATLVAGGEAVTLAAEEDDEDWPEDRPDEDDGWGQGEDDEEWDDEDDVEVDVDEEEDEAFVAHVTAEPDVVVTHRTDGSAQADVVLVIALPALAREVTEALPVGALDAAAGLMGQGDDLTFVEEPAEAEVALRVPGAEEVTYEGLAPWAQRQLPARLRDAEIARVLCRPESVAVALGHALAIWHAGGAVVLLSEEIPAGRVADIVAAENATQRA